MDDFEATSVHFGEHHVRYEREQFTGDANTGGRYPIPETEVVKKRTVKYPDSGEITETPLRTEFATLTFEKQVGGRRSSWTTGNTRNHNVTLTASGDRNP